MMRLGGLLLAFSFGLCPLTSHAQVPVILYPAGTYSITTPASTQISIGPTSVLFSWGEGPIPPQPIPVPPQPPAPPVPPSPAKHIGPFYVSLILPQAVTQDQNDLRVGLLTLDRSVLKIHGIRSYYDGAAELKKLGLDTAVLKHTLPVVIVQEKPVAAKDGDPWPIVDAIEPTSVADVKTRLEGLIK